MKTKYWIMLLSLLLAICIALSIWLFLPKEQAAYVKVYSDGKLLHTLALSQDTVITVSTQRGSNTVTVKDGKVAVTEASCPDKHCMNRGFCSAGVQIVCLPNRLVLEFTAKADLDAIS